MLFRFLHRGNEDMFVSSAEEIKKQFVSSVEETKKNSVPG